MVIPRIIHQTWRDDGIPGPLRSLAESWKRHHVGWEYRLWTDQQNREFIRIHYPEFLERYDSYPYPIQRADAVRYFFLYTFGGLYIDLDFECFRSLEVLLSEHECLFGLEPPEHCAIHNRNIISNALMATVPQHPFFRAIIADLLEYTPPETHRNNVILETTGPFMLTRVYNRAPLHAVTLLPSRYFYPLSLAEIERGSQQGWSESDLLKLREAYAIHYFAGTWWK